jgi:hypothetical protein
VEGHRRCRGIGLRHWCNKGVAASGHRLDAAALLSILIEDVTQFRNLAVPQPAWRAIGESGAVSRLEALRSGDKARRA